MEINLTLQVVQEKLSDDRLDSMFYKGDIAYVSLPSGNKLYAEATGEIRMMFEEDGVYYKGINAQEELRDRGLTDKDLLDMSFKDLIDMNNWFSIIKVDINGEVIDDDVPVTGDYNEALEILMDCAKEEYKKEYKTFGGLE